MTANQASLVQLPLEPSEAIHTAKEKTYRGITAPESHEIQGMPLWLGCIPGIKAVTTDNNGYASLVAGGTTSLPESSSLQSLELTCLCTSTFRHCCTFRLDSFRSRCLIKRRQICTVLPQFQFPEEHIQNHEDKRGLKSHQNRGASFVLYNGWQFDNRRLINY